MVDYSPLWDTMQKRKITQYTLLKDKVLDNHTLDRLKKGQNITLVTLERICKYLSCTPNKVILAGMSVMGISSFCFANQPPGLSRPDVGECKSN